MRELRLADTSLAWWLSEQMAIWRDPYTNLAGLSQRGLAELAGVSQAQVSAILKGGQIPKAETLTALGAFFKVHPWILHFIAYEMEDVDPDGLDRLTRFGQAIYPLPEEVLLDFMEDLVPRAEAALREIEDQDRGEDAE